MKGKATKTSVSSQEKRLLEQLRRHPQSSNEIEELLIAELRKLGHATMTQWASQAEERLAQELKAQDTRRQTLRLLPAQGAEHVIA